MREQFGMEILALIHQHYPAALKGDPEQIARCSVDLAVTLGGLVAFARQFGGQDGANAAVDLIVDKIVENAAAIDAKAAAELRGGLSRRLGQH